MDTIREWLRRVWYLLNRRRLDALLREEMDAHRAEMGEPARFGNTLRLREEAQDVWGWRWLDHLSRDVSYSMRALARTPFFTAVAIVTLAFGVGANLVFFQIVNGLLLQPHPVTDPETLARFNRACCGRGEASSISSALPEPMADFVARRSGVLSAVLTRRSAELVLGLDGVDRVRTAFVSANWFDELGGTAALGRVFEAGDGVGAGTTGVLSFDFWQRHLAGRPDVLGRTIHLNDRPVTVVGVAAAAFPDVGLGSPDVWLPIEGADAFFDVGNGSADSWQSLVDVYGRFAPGLGVAAVREGLRSTLADLSRERPDQVRPDEWLEPLQASLRFMDASERRQVAGIVLVASALTLLVLLVAALDLGNLMLARAVTRVRELGVRSALGASRLRVMRYLMLDGILICVAGGAAGLVLSLVVMRSLVVLAALPRSLDLMPDWRTALVCFGGIALAALVVTVPAAWRVGRRDLALAVRDGGDRATSGLDSVRLRSVLTASQLAGCAILLVFAGQLARGLDRLSAGEIGFDYENVAVLDPSLPVFGLTPAAAFGYWADVRARVTASPEVEMAALVTNAPLGQMRSTSIYVSTPHLIVATLTVEPDFFDLMRIPIVAGRGFRPDDEPGTVAIVSRKVALETYGRLDVAGDRFPRDGGDRTIVGVAGDARLFMPNATGMGEAYGLLSTSAAADAVLLVRARIEVTRLPALMRRASRDALPHVTPVVRLMRMDFAERAQPVRVASAVAASIALLALALACIGVAGIVSFVASRRVKEIGIRLALGASSLAAVRAIVGGAVVTAALGALPGLGVGWLVGHLLAGEPFYAEPMDAWPYAAAALALLLAAGSAAAWPAWRLLRADPTRALRFD